MLRSVAHARELGIDTIFQDLAPADQLPENLNMHLNSQARSHHRRGSEIKIGEDTG